MNSEEYANLEQVEERHWFYAGKRQIVVTWLRRLRALDRAKLLVDCGAGTGRFAEEAAEFCQVLAVDDHEESLALARRRLGKQRVRKGSCTQLPLESSSADVVTALDVIEHVPDDSAAIREMVRILKPGGTIVVTVPALMELWSDWDVSLHHCRRYRRTQLVSLLEKSHLELVHCSYINVLAFPAVFALRKWRARPGAREAKPGERAEEKVPPRWLNGLLQRLFVELALWKVVFPFGVGLLAVARRPIAPTAKVLSR